MDDDERIDEDLEVAIEIWGQEIKRLQHPISIIIIDKLIKFHICF